MTDITINGHEYSVTFNMQAACLYERTTKRNPLRAEEFDESLENRLTLAYCMIAVNNKDAEDFDTLLTTINAQEMVSLLATAMSEFNLYFKPLPGDIADEEGKGDKEEKNA